MAEDKTDPVSELLERHRAEIRERMEQLRPVVEEHERLEAAERALSGVVEPPRRPGRPRAAA
jgi:hypothetical protein